MRPYLSLILLLLLLLSYGVVHAEYWFQTGAIGDSHTYNNGGASISIRTVLPQNLKSGSVAFWVGEPLQNGAFVQSGYLINNISGIYPSVCTSSGCSGYENITAGDAEWFYEYFPSSSATTFLGGIGPQGSAGVNGTLNTYGFYSTGDTWNFIFNGKKVGSVALGTGSSGNNPPVAFAELANASNDKQTINQVAFRNFTFYQNGAFIPVPYGYSYVGYGVGSKTNVLNNYGIKEFGNNVNYFLIGTGLPIPANNTKLWSQGYLLRILSQFGNLSQATQYLAFTRTNITAPRIVNLGTGNRAAFVQWLGTGFGSYSGALNTSSVLLDSNITEQVQWQQQYFLNLSSRFSSLLGAGWYVANALAQYSLLSNVSYSNATSRYLFEGWSNGQRNTTGTIYMNGPQNLSAKWQHQLLMNASSPYGVVQGDGWYAQNSVARLSLNTTLIRTGTTQQTAFYGWSNGAKASTLVLNVTKPLKINAIFKEQYLTAFGATDVYGNQVSALLYLNNQTVLQPQFIFTGVNYTINSAKFEGLVLPVNNTFTVNSSGTVQIQLPLYNVLVTATDLFGIPVNVSTKLQFPNGTTSTLYTGAGGSLELYDVPYGSAIGNATYGGISTPVHATFGAPIRLFFLSTLDIGVFAGIMVATVVMYLIAARALLRKEKRKERAEKVWRKK